MTEQTPDPLADLIAAAMFEHDNPRSVWLDPGEYVAAVIRAAQADDTEVVLRADVAHARSAGESYRRQRDAARAELATLRAAQPGREQVARALADADPHLRLDAASATPEPDREHYWRLADAVLALFRQDQP